MGEPNVRETCYICDRPTDANDFCPGCQEWICKECDEERPVEAHEPDTHKSWAGD
jgi:hypothetical protein